jgi:hypothetical protein
MIDMVHLVRYHRNGISGANLRAQSAADTTIRNLVGDQLSTPPSWTAAVEMRLVFVSKILHCRKDRIGGRTPQATDAPRGDHFSQFTKLVEVPALSLAGADPIHDLEHPFCADTAECALAAGLILSEPEKVAGDIDHAVGLIEHNKAATPHDGAHAGEGLVVDRRVGELGRHTSAGGTADQDRLETAVPRNPAADLLDNVAERRPHRHLDQSATGHLSGEGEDLGTRAPRRAEGRKFSATMPQDPGHEGKRLDIVDECGTPPES